MKFSGIFFLCLICIGGLSAAELPDVPAEAIDELGFTTGTPQMSGFVFLDGRYLPPPYTVTRKGNGLFINRIQFEQPVAWSCFEAKPAAAADAAPKKAVDADGDFQTVTPAATEGPSAEPKTEGAEKQKAVKSIDDLFSDTEADTGDGKKAPAASAAAPAEKTGTQAFAALPPSPEEIARQKQDLKKNLDVLRKNYETALAKGEIFFLGQRHNRVNGNYGTARTLIEGLPNALRYAQSPEDLMRRLQQSGVYFLDLKICAALYGNKTTFPLLQERLEKIKEDEAFEAQRKSGTRSW